MYSTFRIPKWMNELLKIHSLSSLPKIEIPDMEFQRRNSLGKVSPAELRDELKKRGETPLRERYRMKL